MDTDGEGEAVSELPGMWEEADFLGGKDAEDGYGGEPRIDEDETNTERLVREIKKRLEPMAMLVSRSDREWTDDIRRAYVQRQRQRIQR